MKLFNLKYALIVLVIGILVVYCIHNGVEIAVDKIFDLVNPGVQL